VTAHRDIASRPLRVLVLEDSATDAELEIRELRRAGFDPEWQRVETESEFTAALALPPELILADYALPHFDGLTALAQVRARSLDTPFILVSGSLGEEAAVAAMKQGATDFLLKDRLTRLGSAVERALEEQHLRSERRRLDEQLAGSERQLRAIFDTEPESVTLFAADGSLIKMNPAGWRMLDAESFEQVRDQSVYRLLIDEDRAAFEAIVAAVFRGESGSLEFQIDGLKGRRRRLEMHASPLYDGAGAIESMLGIARDITARKEQEIKIARLSRIRAVIGGISSAMLRARDRDQLLNEACRVAAQDGVFPLAWVTLVDAHKQVFQIVALHGVDPTLFDPIQRALQALPDEQRPACRVASSGQRLVFNDVSTDTTSATLGESLQRSGYLSAAAFPLFVDGRVVAVLALLASERDFFDDEEIALLEWLTADLSFALASIEKSAQLDHLAYFDALTGLCNARLFQDRLNQFVEIARQEQSKVCVIVADIEDFTQINDSLGRAVGDEVLRQAGARFAQHLAEPFVLGRIGADTFAAAYARDDESVAAQIRDRMFEALQQPIVIEGREVRVAVQAGIALFPADGDDGSALFKSAEAALMMAKSSGEHYAYFSSEMNARIARRRLLQEQLGDAIKQQQFVLHYQPRVDMISGELIGGEALIRWQHPQRGLVAPLEFIDVAEESGLIVPIGAWVLNAVCAQQAAWQSAGLMIVPIAVNLSSVQFEKGDLLQTVRDALAAHALAARFLDLELTESAVMNDPVAATQTLQALQKMGAGLALDDFGTGYSSLAHLKRFPFDSVKIDRSFVTDITVNAGDAAIATAIIAMAHSLNLKVVAEGVETQGQFNYLRMRACDEMQGNFFSPAVAAEAFESLMRSDKRMPLPVSANADQRTVLLVDDEQGIRSALARLLRSDGYTILDAASGEEGLDLLALNPVQVVISDQRMPGMSGTTFLNTVKQLYPDTVRIILSGYTDLAVVTDAVNRGAVYKFLTKPWDDHFVRELVRDAFRRFHPG
jgi:diguanylate cyclase (GGDEF)-like protein/PAS domain S-box-containing protein